LETSWSMMNNSNRECVGQEWLTCLPSNRNQSVTEFCGEKCCP
jgi:hypothetical protein